MRTFTRVVPDIFLVMLATLLALLLREDFAISIDRLIGLSPFLVGTLIGASVLLPMTGVSNTISRFSSPHDHMRILFTAAGIVAIALCWGFAVNRLDGVARSLPFLQFGLSYAMLAGSRDLLRWYHLSRLTSKQKPAQFVPVVQDQPLTIIVVGVSRLVEAYLRLLESFGSNKIRVAAVMGRQDRHKGRILRNHRIVGSLAVLEDVLQDLKVRGITVDRIILSESRQLYNLRDLEVLDRVSAAEGIGVQVLTEALMLGETGSISEARLAEPQHAIAGKPRFVISSAQAEALAARPYWLLKRTFDFIVALMLLIIFSPVYLVTGLLVMFDVGLPIFFRQQRPGLGGKPLQVLKFRTMRSAYAPDGSKLSDEQRTSALGAFIRGCRLDELPQLVSILFGEMSFVGPRPLLPIDQPDAGDARLLIRPGLTGWAQVSGGRLVSPEDKAALDLWYIQNANLWLDMKIICMTAIMLLRGDSCDLGQIAVAWRDLAKAGIVRGSPAE
jgi:lipopolysaccharide/colanic/teichoic acid biosynthesis glycosyltransferase